VSTVKINSSDAFKEIAMLLQSVFELTGSCVAEINTEAKHCLESRQLDDSNPGLATKYVDAIFCVGF